MIMDIQDADPSGGQLKPFVASGHRAGWIDRLPTLVAEGLDRSTPPRASSWFRLGDAYLQIASDGNAFLEEFEARYRDCVVAEPSQDLIRVRCTAIRPAGTPLLCLSFDGDDLTDPMSAAGTRFRMLRHLARYVAEPGPAPGWRMLVDHQDSHRRLAAGDDRRLVIDLDEAPVEFATDCIVSLVQSAQRDVLFLHGASFGIAGAGALLLGWGQAGKSTTSLALAVRGHSFLGDDLAAVRVKTREVLPFPKAVSLRTGGYLRTFEGRLRVARHVTAVDHNGARRTVVSMGDLFPGSVGPMLPLRFAFLLDGFAAHPRLTPYRPGIADAKRLRAVANESTPDWGLSPGRDLMRFLTVVNLLSGLDCRLLELGSPEDSAAAIEGVMEAACHST